MISIQHNEVWLDDLPIDGSRKGAVAIHQGQILNLPRCPHCQIANPNLTQRWGGETADSRGGRKRGWVAYGCQACGGVVLAANSHGVQTISEMYPIVRNVADEIPERARALLVQCQESLHAPAGAVVLGASAVDAMLKAKKYKDGNLKSRIDKAAADGVITQEMAAWAHDVRLDANDQRHADESQSLPTEEDAQRVLDFACALAEYLFVLPSKVRRGRRLPDESKGEPTTS